MEGSVTGLFSASHDVFHDLLLLLRSRRLILQRVVRHIRLRRLRWDIRI